MSKVYDVIVLGAGPAGLAAGLYAGSLRQRYRKETALCGCEEIAILEPTENNVLTIA